MKPSWFYNLLFVNLLKSQVITKFHQQFVEVGLTDIFGVNSCYSSHIIKQFIMIIKSMFFVLKAFMLRRGHYMCHLPDKNKKYSQVEDSTT